MARICTFDDLNKSSKPICRPINKSNHKSKYKFAYRLGSRNDKHKSRFNTFILQILEYVFVFYRFFKKPTMNNIMSIHEDVDIYNNDKVLTCRAILDTGNEGITIVSRSMLYKLGYCDADFNKGHKISTFGIGGREDMKTIYLCYNICGFEHEGHVGVSTKNDVISEQYDMIVSQHDISKMYHSGYNLHI